MEAKGAAARAPRRHHATTLAREYRGAKVLLAEDNEANQMVATELLSILGIELDIAGNGRQAVDMARANPGGYACVLMDMQMPEMDGLEATQDASRRPGVPRPAHHRDDGQRDEAGPGRVPGRRHERLHHQADRSRRARGDAAQVAAGVGAAHWRPNWPLRRLPSTPSTSSTPSTPSTPSLDGLNVDGALARLGIGFEALRRMLIRFADGQARTLADLVAAADAGDADAAARHAHAIAGAAGNLGADTLREAAKALETAARAGERDLADLGQRVRGTGGGGVPLDSTPCAHPQTWKFGATPGAGATPPSPRGRRACADRWGRARRALLALHEALASSDPDATETALAALGGLQLPETAGARRDARAGLADEYQFDEADREIASLLERLTTEPTS